MAERVGKIIERSDFIVNKPRREALQKLHDVISDALDNLDGVRDEEDEYKENIPENLQCSERYEKAESAVEALENALSSLEDALYYIEEAQQ